MSQFYQSSKEVTIDYEMLKTFCTYSEMETGNLKENKNMRGKAIAIALRHILWIMAK
jgi:hypothetical protein